MSEICPIFAPETNQISDTRSMIKYEVLQSISQGEDGTLSCENAELVILANDIFTATRSSGDDEGESSVRIDNVIIQNEKEQRASEDWAIKTNHWIPFAKVFELGLPGPSGSESDTYLSKDGYVYKQNNLLHCSGSIVDALIRFILHNLVFPDTAYSFVGFTGFRGRSVYPIVKQCFIEGGRPATQNEIDCYMAALGFAKTGIGRFRNEQFVLFDLLPKNALKDESGDVYVIDAEISLVESSQSPE